MRPRLSWRDWLERPWALHPFLFAILPVVRLYAGNTDCIDLGTALRAGALVCAMVTGALLVAWPVLGVRTGSLVVSIAVGAATLRFPGLLELLVLGLFAVMAAVVVLAPRRDFALLVTFANGVGAVLLVSTPLLDPRFRNGFSADNLSIEPLPGYLEALDGALAGESAADGPDVWWILLDGHGRSDVLRDKYGVDDGFDDFLRSRGFYVAEDARSNYAQTVLSVASTLNLAPVEDLLVGIGEDTDRRLPIGALARDNRVVRLFRSQGYRIVSFPSEYALTEPRDVDARRVPFGFLQEFDLGLLGTTPIPSIAQVAGGTPSALQYALRRRSLDLTLDRLARGDEDPGPTLVLAHIVAPHPPFVFDREGNPVHSEAESSLSDGSDWDALHAGTGEDYVQGYAEQVRWLHVRIREVVDGILASSAQPPVILIQGDHGPGADLDWDSVDRTDLRERMTILSAYHLPTGEERLYPSITPVNSFRVVLSELFGAELPLLPDRSAFQTTARPHHHVDVTDRLGPIRGPAARPR